MSSRISTYLPPWQNTKGQRVCGNDEDSVTLAVSAGREALGTDTCHTVVVVSRQPALLEGGSAAVICAGLGIPDSTCVVESIGGASATLDALAGASPGTLVIGVDSDPAAGAGAMLIGAESPIALVARVLRSLPTRTRDRDGNVFHDDDARLERERGLKASLARAALPGRPAIIAGIGSREAKSFCDQSGPELPTLGASSPIFALARLAEQGNPGLVAALEQANLTAANFSADCQVTRIEPEAQPLPKQRENPGPDIKIALTAYDRAFVPKLRWESGCCPHCQTLAMPPRHRCITCGSEGDSTLKPLPRQGEIYTSATIHVPVPGIKTPYTLAIVALDGVDVRVLVTVTDVAPGTVAIGDRGEMVFRRISVRSGVPDYGYAFSPHRTSHQGEQP